jgi:hypothetical protein
VVEPIEVTLGEHTLVTYLHAVVGGDEAEQAEAAYQQLRHAYLHLGKALGLTAPSPGIAPDPDPHRPETLRSALLAGRTPGSSNSHGLRQMWCDQIHDVACVSVVLTRDGATDPGWAGLRDEWHAATAGLALDRLLGMAEIFTASTARVGVDETTAALVAENLPQGVLLGPDWATSCAATTGGLALFQLSTPGHDQRVRRVLAVIAPSGNVGDTELSTWVWRTGLGRLPMYLLNHAKLRDQTDIVRRDRPTVANMRMKASKELADLHSVIAAPDSLTSEQLRRAQKDLNELQVETSGLVDMIARIEIVRRTVAIAAHNMAQVVGGVVDPAHSALFEADQRLAQRLDRELDDEHTYLAAASLRAENVAAIAAQQLTRRSDEARQAGQHLENQLTLLQTTIVGTILAILAAVQAFGVTVDLPMSNGAVTVTIGAVALLLSALAQRQAHLTRRADQPVPPWINIVVSLSFGAAAASVAWTITTVDWSALQFHIHASVGFLAVALTFVAVTAGAYAVSHALRRGK